MIQYDRLTVTITDEYRFQLITLRSTSCIKRRALKIHSCVLTFLYLVFQDVTSLNSHRGEEVLTGGRLGGSETDRLDSFMSDNRSLLDSS